MDYAQSCYFTGMKLWADSDEVTPVRWFFAAPGAKLFPGTHAFGSMYNRQLRWPIQLGQITPPIGEQKPTKHNWDPGTNYNGYTGEHFDGRLEAYRSGGITGVDSIVTLAEGTTADCGFPAIVGNQCMRGPRTLYAHLTWLDQYPPVSLGTVALQWGPVDNTIHTVLTAFPPGWWSVGPGGPLTFGLILGCNIPPGGVGLGVFIFGYGAFPIQASLPTVFMPTPFRIEFPPTQIFINYEGFQFGGNVSVIITGTADPPGPLLAYGQGVEGEVLAGSPAGAWPHYAPDGQAVEGEVLAGGAHGGMGLAGQAVEGEVLAGGAHGGMGLAGQGVEGEVLAGDAHGGGGGPTVYLLDTFVGTAGTALTAHGMNTGPGWSAGPGSSGILNPSGTANVPSGGGNHADAGHHDGTCTVSASRTSTGAARVFFAFTDNTHFWEVRLVAGALQILETTGGAPITRASVAHTYTAGVFYPVTVTVAGTAVTASADGVTANYATMGTGLAATAWGIGAFTTAANFRTFEVTA